MPVTWQGWLSVIVLVGVAVATTFAVLPLDSRQPTTAQLVVFLSGLAVYVLAIVVVALAKGPVPRWRWGERPDDNPDEDF